MNVTRRNFLKTGAAALAGFTIAPSTILGKSHGYQAPSDKLNIIAAGIGGRGSSDLAGMATENIIGLADVDWKYAKPIFEKYPSAKRYWDYRKMFEELGKEADAVIVATPDHNHAIIASEAITMGKAVYVEKPLTHSIYEARLLSKLAKKYNVVTQMGNQGSSDIGVRKAMQWIANGEIGEVRKVEAFTDRPIWPQGLNTPEKADRIPKTLNWDLFIGPAKYRDYNMLYHPWNWRGWWDFGTGALGDMACHILHAPFKALNLGYPTKVQGSSTALLVDCAPVSERVRFVFPARENLPKCAMPECEVIWYDGGIQPIRVPGCPKGRNLNDEGGAAIFYGTKDTLVTGCYSINPWLFSGREPKYEPVKGHEITRDGHHQDFVRAVKEGPKGMKPYSDFEEAGKLTEMIDLGVIAVRLQSLNQELEWDGENMRFTNIDKDATIKTMILDGFTVDGGHPTFTKTYTDPVNANEFAQELIKHTYREGWKLVDMPK